MIAGHYAARPCVIAVRGGFNLFIVPRSHVFLLPRTARETNAKSGAFARKFHAAACRICPTLAQHIMKTKKYLNLF